MHHCCPYIYKQQMLMLSESLSMYSCTPPQPQIAFKINRDELLKINPGLTQTFVCQLSRQRYFDPEAAISSSFCDKRLYTLKL